MVQQQLHQIGLVPQDAPHQRCVSATVLLYIDLCAIRDQQANALAVAIRCCHKQRSMSAEGAWVNIGSMFQEGFKNQEVFAWREGETIAVRCASRHEEMCERSARVMRFAL